MEESVEGIEKEHFSWKRLVTTTLIVVFTAGVVFGITWFILDKMTNENEEASDKLRIELQKQIDDLRVKLKNTSTTSKAGDSQTYTNTKYGFEFTVPTDWTGYKIYEKDVDGATKTWYVELPTTDPTWAKATSTSEAGYVSLFAISAYTKAEWDEAQSAGGPSDTKITTIGDYTFGWMGAQAGATDIAATKTSAVKSIISTFKAI